MQRSKPTKKKGSEASFFYSLDYSKRPIPRFNKKKSKKLIFKS